MGLFKRAGAAVTEDLGGLADPGKPALRGLLESLREALSAAEAALECERVLAAELEDRAGTSPRDRDVTLSQLLGAREISRRLRRHIDAIEDTISGGRREA